MREQIDNRGHKDGERYRHPDAKQPQEDREDQDQFGTGAHRDASARRNRTLVAIVRSNARHNSAIPIPIDVCGIQSGVASGVGATSSVRNELSASRINCQVTSAEATSDISSNTICEMMRADGDSRICTNSTRWNAPRDSATDMLRKVSATRR